MKGFVLIDKPKGISSFDVVYKVRKATGVKKVGHSGTLDPLATGLLLVAVGEGTKLLEFLIGCDKEYEVVAHFGFVSDTYDAEGSLTKIDDQKKCSIGDVEPLLMSFLGEISQVPPKYSALKINGKPAYELARSGKDVEMKARAVFVEKFEVTSFKWPLVTFRVKCSAGTYIRSLVHDLGALLGCGAYVQELRRTVVGDFSVENALSVEDFSKNPEGGLIPLESIVANFYRLNLSDEDYSGLRDGRILNKKVEHDGVIMAFYKDVLVGVLEMVSEGVKYKKVIH
ncbi:tRNA pseudouridine(55) synthase TruB [Candidatus Peregrinibacteria bacterium CG10_big_fil_rev_8_21_14_0_10_36_19]|nr:MAG: tRNA pseudouridine(55) synthase TruB [Candidatus Peregrinibacteria bacterium CG10_big_fil_rev_8_21_14_0_10_36_19]